MCAELHLASYESEGPENNMEKDSRRSLRWAEQTNQVNLNIQLIPGRNKTDLSVLCSQVVPPASRESILREGQSPLKSRAKWFKATGSQENHPTDTFLHPRGRWSGHILASTLSSEEESYYNPCALGSRGTWWFMNHIVRPWWDSSSAKWPQCFSYSYSPPPRTCPWAEVILDELGLPIRIIFNIGSVWKALKGQGWIVFPPTVDLHYDSSLAL